MCLLRVDRIESKHEVTILSGLNEFVVKFFGPPGCKKQPCLALLVVEHVYPV